MNQQSSLFAILRVILLSACIATGSLTSCNTSKKKEQLEAERLAEIERFEKEREAEEAKKKRKQRSAEYQRISRRRLASSKERYPEGTAPLFKIKGIKIFADEINEDILSGNVVVKVERNGDTIISTADRVTVFSDRFEIVGNLIRFWMPADEDKIHVLMGLEDETRLTLSSSGKFAGLRGGDYVTFSLSEN